MFTEIFVFSEMFCVDDCPPVLLVESVNELFTVIVEFELFVVVLDVFVEFC